MSTDKTLADVQPGGRVRLGDQLVLAKLVGAAGLMLAEIDTCGHEVDPAYRRTLYEAWEEGKAALSAQPSPGGQADAADSRVRFDAWLESNSVDTTRWGDGAYTDPAADSYWRVWQAALAARQPVIMDDALAAGDGTLHGAIDHWQERTLRAEAELAARQPVGEPVCFIHPRDAERLRTKEFSLRQVDTYWSRISDSIPVYLGQPAQAVDLDK